MADAYGAGLAFRKSISDAATPALSVLQLAAGQTPTPVANAAIAQGAAFAPKISDFFRGLSGGPQGAVRVKLPPATPAKAPIKAPPAPKAAVTLAAGKAGDLGILSPAARTVLDAKSPAAAFGNLSFRQLLALSQVAENTAPRGQVKPSSTTDAAGAALASIYQSQFSRSLKAAGDDPARQQAAIDAFEKKMLPIALKGNIADEYIYGQTPGDQ